jgi:hypothetical protein
MDLTNNQIEGMSLEELEKERNRLRSMIGGGHLPEFAFQSLSDQLELVLSRIRKLSEDDGLFESTTSL